MIRVRGTTKAKVLLDEEFDELVLIHTLTQKVSDMKDLEPTTRGGLYWSVLCDFSGLQVGEYKYTAKLGGDRVQSGILVIEPFDEDEKVVQVKKAKPTKTIVAYHGGN